MLWLSGSPMRVVDRVGFLGVGFGRSLAFVPHTGCLKTKCLKALDLLKVLLHTNW